ncbi:MAG: cupin domain-containing protein [Deltaproteobacteria bacterium]|nr:cupin domain-containing protein [Deltaproteobacteria bacterium]
MLEKKIADKIRRIRNSQGLTLAKFGEKIGLSKGLLSRIENNQVSPPIATLSRIAKGLEVPISIFFDEKEDRHERYARTLKTQRRQVIRRGTKTGFTYYSLSSLQVRHLIEPFIVQYPVIKKEPARLFDHPGEEFLFVLKGEMELVYDKERIPLKEGDAIHFDSSVPHRGQNTGWQVSECLVVIINREME